MYQRLDKARAEELMGLFVKDRLFQLLLPGLQYLSEKLDDLTSVEAWDEALGVIGTLKRQKTRRDACVLQMRSMLLEQYKIFRSSEGRETSRSKDEATRSTDIVLSLVVIMLSSAKKDPKKNPHLKIIRILMKNLYHSEILRYMMRYVDVKEKPEEEEYGELPEYDYLAGEEDEIKAMLLKGKEFAVEGFAERYEAFVEELLGEEDVRTLLMGKKSLNENFHAKAVYWILGVMIMEQVIDVSPAKLGNKLGRSNGNKYLSPQNTELPPVVQEYIKDLCQQYKKGAE